MAFEIQRQEEGEKSIIAEQKRISRNFVPFVTSPTHGVTFSGVFFTGDRPNWILAGNKSGVQIYPSGHSVVHAFAACSLWDSKGDFLLYTDEVWIFRLYPTYSSHILSKGPTLLEWMPNFQFDGPLPTRSIPRGRSYSNILFDPFTSLIVAASSLQAKFTSYDEDGNRIWEPEGVCVTSGCKPIIELIICSSKHLRTGMWLLYAWAHIAGHVDHIRRVNTSTNFHIKHRSWLTALYSFEFATNEYVNDMTCVTLETSSTESGIKDFIAVGTTIDRGEDLAAKGAVCACYCLFRWSVLILVFYHYLDIHIWDCWSRTRPKH